MRNMEEIIPPLRWRARAAVLTLCATAACLALAACREKPATTEPMGTSTGPAASAGHVPTAGSDTSAGAAGTGAASANASPAAAAFAQPRKATGTVNVQLITNNTSNFWEAMRKGVEAEQPLLPDCQATQQAPKGATPTHNDQKTTVDNVMAGNADGIGLSPIDPDAIVPVIDDAIGKGVPVICFDSDAPKSKRLAYIGTNNYQAGLKAGEEAVKLLPNGGNYVAFVGNMTAQNARDRYRGFQDAVKGHNFTELQPPFQDSADKTGRANSNVADAITKYGDKINLLLGIWSYNGPAIVKQVKAANIRNKVKIVAFDGDQETLKALQEGTIDAAVVQKPYEFGRLSTMLLYNINRKGLDAAFQELQPELDKAGMKRDGNIIDTGVEVVTPGPSADDFLKRLKEKGLDTT